MSALHRIEEAKDASAKFEKGKKQIMNKKKKMSHSKNIKLM